MGVLVLSGDNLDSQSRIRMPVKDPKSRKATKARGADGDISKGIKVQLAWGPSGKRVERGSCGCSALSAHGEDFVKTTGHCSRLGGRWKVGGDMVVPVENRQWTQGPREFSSHVAPRDKGSSAAIGSDRDVESSCPPCCVLRTSVDRLLQWQSLPVFEQGLQFCTVPSQALGGNGLDH